MKLYRRVAKLAVFALFTQASCAEIPTAPGSNVLLRGTVLTRDGEPVVAAVIHIHEEAHGLLLHQTKTQSDGTFVIPMASGVFRVEIQPTSYSGVPSVALDGFRVIRDSPRLDYRYGGFRVDVAVHDPNGDPVDASAILSSRQMSVGGRLSSGVSRAYVPAGTYELFVRPVNETAGVPSAQFSKVPLAADTTITVTLTGHHVTGHVSGPDGLPMQSVEVFYDAGEIRSGAKTTPDGAYDLYIPDAFCEIYAIPGPGDRNIEARSFGYAQISADLNRDLSFAGVWWQGTVRDTTGAPAGGAFIRMDVHGVYSGADGLETYADASGAFRVSVVSGQWHDVFVSAPGLGYSYLGPILAGSDSTVDLVVGLSHIEFVDLARRHDRQGRTSSTLPAARGGAE